MNARFACTRFAIGALVATLLTACASESRPPSPAPSGAQTLWPAAAAIARLTKGLTGSQVRELLGAPPSTKPIAAGGVNGQIWSYPLRTSADVRSVAVATQDVPYVDPLTGRPTTIKEPVFENRSVEQTDMLHLLIVDDRLIEWSIVRSNSAGFR